MSIKFLQKSKLKKLVCTIIGIVVIGFLSPVILTSPKSSNYIAYANTKDKQNSNKYELSDYQSKFFELIDLYNKKNDISIEEIKNNMKGFKLSEIRLMVNGEAHVYSNKNEQLIIYYTQVDGKRDYYVRNYKYKLIDEDSKVSSILLSYEAASYDYNVISLEVATQSISELDKYSKVLGIDKDNAKLYDDYIKLIKAMKSKSIIRKDDLMDINSKFKQIDNLFSLKVSDKEQLDIVYDKDVKNIENIYLGTPRINTIDSSYIYTKTGHLKYEKADIQKYYEEEYNLSYGNIGHIININRENPSDAKELFVNFMMEYSK